METTCSNIDKLPCGPGGPSGPIIPGSPKNHSNSFEHQTNVISINSIYLEVLVVQAVLEDQSCRLRAFQVKRKNKRMRQKLDI